MRKTFIITFIVLAIILIHSQTFADMDAPTVDPYKVSVANVNGASCFEYNYDETTQKTYLQEKMVIEYGTELTVNYEEEQNGEIFANVIDTSGTYLGLVNLNDLEIISLDNLDNYSPNLTQSFSFTVLKEDGVQIHKGPANAYEVIGRTIPYGNSITGYYFKENGSAPWYYVLYQGVSGYISELDGALGRSSTYVRALKTFSDTNVYKNKADFIAQKPSGKINANTVLTSFLEVDPWSRMYYITSGGAKGYVNSYDLATINYEIYINAVKIPEGGLPLYSIANKEDGEVLIENIPEGTKLTIEYMQFDIRGEGWINVTYNNKNGWLFIQEDDLLRDDNIDDSEYDKLLISYENDNTINDENTVDDTTMPVNDANKVDLVATNPPLPTIALICVAVAIIIALTATVTVILMNKKSKKNNNNDIN